MKIGLHIAGALLLGLLVVFLLRACEHKILDENGTRILQGGVER